jgi:hypothetical protein
VGWEAGVDFGGKVFGGLDGVKKDIGEFKG